ncbi:MAG: hypothetical protein IPJ37_12075 [Bacteroidales bacterium]|nr:hypothetical protein [Bacteroidales bacterium]
MKSLYVTYFMAFSMPGVVVGFNHHLASNKEGDYRQLWSWQEKYNFEAEEIPEQEVQHETVSSTKIRKAISEGYIQRANAYLDHYYMILGSAEKLLNDDVEKLPRFIKMTLTEECKLLPSPGIYAVSVEAGSLYSKGMVIINKRGENNPEVLVEIFDDPSLTGEQKIASLFIRRFMAPSTLMISDPCRRSEWQKKRSLILFTEINQSGWPYFH